MKRVAIFFVVLLWSASASAGQVYVSVAASLKEVVDELADSFSRNNRAASIYKNTGGSGILARQIENGAPADIFISADSQWMEYLAARKLMSPATIATFAGNELVFAGKPDRRIKSMKDVALLEKIGIGNPKSVPAGEYAMAAIRSSHVEKSVAKKLVFAKDVRECLLYMERGEVDGGFVYLTEALQAKQAKVIFTVPQSLYPKVEYKMGLTVTGGRNSAAVAFFNYLKGPEAQTVLLKRGFKTRN
ncbi:molybdate ABC transporter substrate-binding protein [Geotalea sp. SG265]|uniref:molybdate ABC transporter substrate-binding protein n=1 Tax=Geotalea sp. SG265 TaxID=2922867 RepID=UPI001FB02606|nr:molybdate ABC transporter substrate-binding protein [Geotalea sp. SG265]